MYGPVPPEAVTVNVVVVPLQAIAAAEAVAVSAAAGWVMVTVVLELQPPVAVTITVYEPAANEEISSVLAVNPLGPVHAKENGAVPPVVVRFIEPVLAFLHKILLTAADRVGAVHPALATKLALIVCAAVTLLKV